MRLVPAIIALSASLWAQGTPITVGVFTKPTPTTGYFVHTIGQWDKAVWIPSKHCYAEWGQYKSATFSEANDALGCWSFAENAWHLLDQATSVHNTDHPQTGHNWGFTDYVSDLDSLFLWSNSGAQGQEQNWVSNLYDFGGNFSYEIPLFSISGTLTHYNVNGAVTVSGFTVYDNVNKKLFFYPDNHFSNISTASQGSICDFTTFTCTLSVAAGGPPSVEQTSSMQFDPDNAKVYFYPGGSAGATLYNISLSTATPSWSPQSSATCVGPDCVSGTPAHPPTRYAPAFAYSTVDHKSLMFGGLNSGSGGTAFNDVWVFDQNANSGNGQWTEQCGPGTGSGGGTVPACGASGTAYPVFSGSLNRQGDRLAFMPEYNAFAYADDNGSMWYYALSTPSNYGTASPSYAPCSSTVGNCNSGITGPLNRTLPPTAATVSNAQTFANDLSIDSSGGTIYIAHVGPTVGSDLSSCNIPVPYIWSSSFSGNWMPNGTQATACSAIGHGTLIQPSGHVFHAKLSSTDWEVNDQRNWSGLSSSGQIVAQSYNTGTNTWSGGAIGCVTATCFSSGGSTPQNWAQGFVNANGTLTILSFEMTTGFYQQASVFLRQWNGSTWDSVTSTTPLNVTASSYPTYGSIAADPSGNMMFCWTEELDPSSNRTTMTTTPQLRCKYYNGSTFTVVNGGSLNVNSGATAGWARAPSVAYASGTWYVGWSEQTQTGVTKIYVDSCPTSGSACTQLSGTPLNNNGTTGRAYHPSLTADGTLLLVGWEEQSARGSQNLLYIKSWNGSAWASVASGVSANTAGSVTETGITVGTSGTVTAAWKEATWGNLPQIYSASYNDSATPSCTINTTSLPSGLIGLAYSQPMSTSNCTGTVVFSVTVGSLPAGLSISASTGIISGTPTTAASSSFTVQVTSTGGGGNDTQPLSIVINTPSLYQSITISEGLYSGALTTGIARTNEPMTMGIPIPDASAITGISGLNLIGASAAQFSVTATWPDGNAKWLKVRAIIPSVSAGGSTAVTLTNAGTGNFGGANLATDNGTTITVNTTGGTCGAGSAVCFTVKKSNFNVLDEVQVGTKTLVSSGTSKGLVILGPNPTATYPGNVTCNPTSGGTACTTVYSTANDGTNSTCAVEENGPAVAVLKCTADLNDGAAHVYMHTMTRLYFYQNLASVKCTAVLLNADYGTSGTFATATKGNQGFELRLTPNLTGTLTYTIANHTGTPTTGTLNSSGGTDYAYIYQSESNTLKPSSWCLDNSSSCVPFTTLTGYAIVNNGTASLTGTANQIPVGWASIADVSGDTIVIGQDQFGGYGNDSLEFDGGGLDLRIGMWARQNNTTSPSSTSGGAPYYVAWPQWDIHNVWMEFATSTPASPQNDFLKYQYPLLGRPPATWYNTAAVLPYPLLDATEETTYYAAMASSSSPSVSPTAVADLPAGSTGASGIDQSCENFVCVFRRWNWGIPGGNNQMEFRYANLLDFIRRGYTGAYSKALNFYKFVSESGFPMSDGFNWRSHSSSEVHYYNFPTATSANASLQSSALNRWIQDDCEHCNAQGFDLAYLMSGDETLGDSLKDGAVDAFADNTSASNYTTVASSLWNDRSVGNALMWTSRLATFLNSIGDATDAATVQANGEAVYTSRLQPALCAYNGYPSACTTDNFDAIPQVGTSTVRGISNVFKDTSVTVGASCSGSIPGSVRTAKPFMTSRKLEGMWEMYQYESAFNPSWAYLNQLWDYAYGAAQWAIFGDGTVNGEMYNYDHTSVWTANGFRYAQAMDYANGCNTGSGVAVTNFDVGNDQTIWLYFTIWNQYTGRTDWGNLMNFNLARDASGTSTQDEFWHYTIGTAIYYLNRPTGLTLNTLPISGFTDNGDTTYTFTVAVPASAQYYRIKYGAKTITDWIGFNAGTYAFVGNPATAQNWFASPDATGIPTPAGTTQTMTVGANTTGLSAGNFMVKAMASPSGGTSTIPSAVFSGATIAH